MEEAFKSIKAFLYERSVSPLFGAFLTAWSAWNYRFFVIIFSNLDADDKFVMIDELYVLEVILNNGQRVEMPLLFLSGIVIPALMTWVYLYIYPRIAEPVYNHSLTVQRKLKKIKQDIADEDLLSVEQSRTIYQQMAEIETKYDEEVERYRNQISALNEVINSTRSQISEPIASTSQILDDVIAEGEKVLAESHRIEDIECSSIEISALITASKLSPASYLFPADLVSRFKISLSESFKVLESLSDKKLLTGFGTNNNNDPTYRLNADGKRYLVLNNHLDK